MNEWRREFPVTEEWAFLNHAAVAPLSRTAWDKIAAWSEDFARHGNAHEGAWTREIEARRRDAARLLNAQPSEIAFLKNTSEGLSLVAEGFPWKEGDNVVIAEGEYPANVYPWLHLARRGVETRIVPATGGRITPEATESHFDERTRLLSISFVQFASGFRSDLARLGEICHRRGIDFCVDAIQGLGVFPIDVDAMRIDYLSADGHKWLVGPEGAAVFFIREELLEKIVPTSVGWKSVVNATDFSTIDFRFKSSAARYEQGSLNTVGVLALGANIELFLTLGVETINQAVRGITDELVGRLQSAGVSVFSPRGEGEWSGIVSFAWPSGDPLSVVRHCRQKGVVIATRAGRLRASPHFYNDSGDLDRLFEALREV